MRGTAQARLMVVDDEADFRDMVADCLLRDGYTVRQAANGVEMDEALASSRADLILLDVAMPGEDGLSIARRVKAAGHTPIIMLSALSETLDRVVGLEVGADDYLAKPVDLRELRARVRAVLRRGLPADEVPPPPVAPGALSEETVRFGSALVNLADRLLIDSSGETVTLTPTESAMIETFLRHPNRVLTRERLAMRHEGEDAPCPLERAVDIRVTRIRKKVEEDPRRPRVIRTVRGAGYIYVPNSVA